jgi:hypothetical protein
MAERVPDVFSPKALYRELVEGGALCAFGNKALLGLIVPMSQEGYYFPSALTKRSDERVVLNESFRQLLDSEREVSKHFTPVSPTTHEGCPVAKRVVGGKSSQTGIQDLARLLLNIVL